MIDEYLPPSDGDATAPSQETDAATEHPNNHSLPQLHRDAMPPYGGPRPATNFLPDLSPYTLTIGQAIDRFSLTGCNRPSERTMQRYCQSSEIDCYKITTTRNGKPVTEWLVNESSLTKFIESRPSHGVATAEAGDASDARQIADTQSVKPNDMATPDPDGDAWRRHDEAPPVEMTPDDMATPPLAGDAKTETRTLAEVLIDNARLTAELAGRDALLEQIVDDRTFLREELKEARKLRGDVREIAERTLMTLETIALGGKLNRLREAPRMTGDNGSAQRPDDDVE